ncbi:MAG: class I SAM-dependent methyltransferase [Xenococcus sp. (in: cyanobacteria)]
MKPSKSVKIRYKSDYNFYSYKDQRFRFQGAWEDGGDCMIGMDESAILYWQGIAKDFLLVCVNHDWSGICQIKCDDNKITSDNYAPSSYQKVIPVVENEQPEMLNIELAVVGKNEQSHASQIAVVGFLARESEPNFYSYQDERLKFEGTWEKGEDDTIIGMDQTAILRWQGMAKDFYLVSVSHDWSGICQIKCNGEITKLDNYATFSHQNIIPIAQKDQPEMLDIEISVIGKNEQSNSHQMVLRGFLASGLEESQREETVVRQFPNLNNSANKQLADKIKQNRIHELLYQIFNQDVDINSMVQHRHSVYLKEWQKIASYISKGSKMLDIGSGYHFDSLLNLFAENQWDYYYLDRNPYLLEVNKQAEKSLSLRSANNFVYCDSPSLPFYDRCFDCVVSHLYIEKLTYLEELVREIHRVLKTKGLLVLSTSFGLDLENDEELYFWDLSELKELVKAFGFSLINCESNSILSSLRNKSLSILATPEYK